MYKANKNGKVHQNGPKINETVLIWKKKKDLTVFELAQRFRKEIVL